MKDIGWILGALPMGVWVARAPSGQVEYANIAFAEIVGVGAIAELLIEGAPAAYGLFDQSGQPYPVERLPFSRALASRKPATVEDIVIHRPDGKRINVRAFGMPVLEGDEVTHVIVAFSDSTKEVEAGRARDTMEAQLALAVNHAPIAIWSADKDGVVGMSEGAGLKSLGVTAGQLVGQNLFDLYRDHPTIPGHIRRGLAGEAFWYSAEASGAVYDTYLTPLRDANGAVVGVAGLSNDVTELRRLQANAIQNDRIVALGMLAASVAHEINNPLTYLLARMQLSDRSLEDLGKLLESIDGPIGKEAQSLLQSVRKELQPVQSAAERIAQITRQLKTFSRSPEERLEPIDIRNVVHAVLELVSKDVATRAQLRLELAEVGYVLADEARLVQVVLNLMLNAMQAVETHKRAHSEIVVRSHQLSDRVALEVEDNGPGVPLPNRERIFDPFFSTKDIGTGTGLGLFVCRNIVRSFGGDIGVSDRPGGGSLFRVTLPSRQSRPAATAPKPAAPEPPSVRRARILLIDDELLVRQALSEALERAGHDVTSVDNGTTALELLLSDRPFDLIFCDLMMRGMTGMDLAEELRARAPRRIDNMVFMCGGAFTAEAQRLMETYPNQSIDKPFDVIAETRARLLS